MESVHIWDNFFTHFGLNDLVTLPASIKLEKAILLEEPQQLKDPLLII